MTSADSEREELAGLVRELGVVHGHVTLASGAEADYYVDLRRVTLHHRAAPLVGRLMRVLTADWDYTAVGGLTLGADPVADAVLHAVAAEHAGRRVLVVEDTSTTGGSVLTAVRAVRQEGAEVVGVATVVDRGTGAREAIEAEGAAYRSLLGLADLGLA